MRVHIAAIALCSVQYATATVITTCVANNCLREVVASGFPTRHPSADCSAYLDKTVTPAQVTTTTTAVTTVTTDVYFPAAVAKRDTLPEAAAPILPRQVPAAATTIPAYASGCTSPSAYSSACSCIGVTAVTTTIAPATTTTTVTSTTTVTVNLSPRPTFVLQLENSGIVLDGVALDGTHGQTDDGDGIILGFNGSPRSDAAVLEINEFGNLLFRDISYVGVQDPGQAFELIHFQPASDPIDDVLLVHCSIVGVALKCGTGFNNILQLCPGFAVTDDVFLGSYLHDGCVSPTFKVVPVV